ncbi:gamma aminobutyric acid receptor subunit [Brachionus plicatilis]|uniref:Gamma aminobutyric acid receptor subunit n=1 Tax=Brachionus plicatilis TaxID=10195 RepID=A0A3M7PFK3_BRAPC|nr:gamma aminobutyric acid receptor subunit [Brachionus plicatilis]
MDTQEWQVYQHIQTNGSIKKSEFSLDQYSAFTVEINVCRMPSYYLCNAFFLVFMITSTLFTKFAGGCHLIDLRLLIDTTVVFTLITFKWVVSEDIPQISYLTSLDKYILFSIIFTVCQCIYDSVMASSTLPLCAMPYRTYDIYALIISSSLFTLVNLVLIIWILVVALRNRYDKYKHIKESSDSNTKRLYQLYNQDIPNTNTEEVENVEDSLSDDSKNSDTDSIQSQTIKL